MSFHGLLDWRLACDLLDVLVNGGADLSQRWGDLPSHGIRSFVEGFAGDGFELDEAHVRPLARSDSVVVVPVHPLEQPPGFMDDGLANLVTNLEDEGFLLGSDMEALGGFTKGGKIVFATDFDLLRRPGHVYASLWAG